jgi:hypothetical protein
MTAFDARVQMMHTGLHGRSDWRMTRLTTVIDHSNLHQVLEFMPKPMHNKDRA